MEEVNKNNELDNTDKKLHISDVKNSLSNKSETEEILDIILDFQRKSIKQNLELWHTDKIEKKKWYKFWK